MLAWIFSVERRMRLPSVLTGHTTSGSSTTEPSVIFQLVASSTTSRKKSVKMCRKPSARNSENARARARHR